MRLLIATVVVLVLFMQAVVVGGEEGWREIIDQYQWDAKVAEMVMMCESEGDAAAVNGRYVGLFQIDSVLHRWTAEELVVPEINIAAAFEKYQQSGWQPWPRCGLPGGLPGTGHGPGE